MLYVAYTAAPFVNFVYLVLPPFARRSRDHAVQYARNLPPQAVLHIQTMRYNLVPRLTVVRVGDLVPAEGRFRPVSFRLQNAAARPWWQGRMLTQFYAADKSQASMAAAPAAPPSSTYYPGLWDSVYSQIQKPGPAKRIRQL